MKKTYIIGTSNKDYFLYDVVGGEPIFISNHRKAKKFYSLDFAADYITVLHTQSCNRYYYVYVLKNSSKKELKKAIL